MKLISGSFPVFVPLTDFYKWDGGLLHWKVDNELVDWLVANVGQKAFNMNAFIRHAANWHITPVYNTGIVKLDKPQDKAILYFRKRSDAILFKLIWCNHG